LSRLDDSADLGIINAFGGTTAVDERIKHGRGVVEVSATWKTEFVEHGVASSPYARHAVPPGW
jgi:hypothetical protein